MPNPSSEAARTSPTKSGIGCRGSPIDMATTSPPGAWASSSFRRRGNAYSGRFENRSGNAIMPHCRGRNAPFKSDDSPSSRAGPEKRRCAQGLQGKIVSFSPFAGPQPRTRSAAAPSRSSRASPARRPHQADPAGRLAPSAGSARRAPSGCRSGCCAAPAGFR